MWYGPLDLRIDEWPTPEPAAGEVLLHVARNGICGSDLHTYLGAAKGGATMHVPGVVLGHEFSGTVAALGDGVDDLALGTAVAVAPIEWCGSCWGCQHASPNLCRRVGLYGGYRMPLHGGLAEWVAVSRRACHVVPAGLSVEHAALAEPMAVALHAARRAPELLGSTVLVLGAGPIGLGVLQAARAGGATSVLVSEPSRARRDAASALGATEVVDPTHDDVRTAVRDVSRHGLDLVFDTTANSAAFNQGLATLRPHGTLVSVAGWGELAAVDMGLAMAKELDVRFSMTYQPEIDFPATLAMLAGGAFDPVAMVTDHIPLDAVVSGGIDELLHHADRHIKILVDPNG